MALLVVLCEACQGRQLIPLSRVVSLVATTDREAGRVVHEIVYRCWCDHVGLHRIVGPRLRRTPDADSMRAR